MQKKLIALAIAGLAAAPAFADTANVRIYGSLDALFADLSNETSAPKGIKMDDNTHKTSRLGFDGSEDLGGGMKAFFALEERFDLDTSTADGTLRFKDKAWIGLSGGFGSVSLGRVPTALDIIYGGGKAANVDTIADVPSRKSRAEGRVDNGISYTSPKLGAVTLYAHTAARETSSATPYGLAASTTIGNFFVEGGWQRDVTCYKTVLLNGGVKLGDINLYGALSRSKGYAAANCNLSSSQGRQRAAVGMDAPVGANGKVYVTLTNGKEKNSSGAVTEKLTKLGTAYVHNLSKRTQLIGAVTFETKKDGSGTGLFAGTSKNQTGVQGGLRHAF